MLVRVTKLESENQVPTSFTAGVHILGRGDLLQCNDKKVSRRHASLEVTENFARLTSIHINPCFLRTAEGKVVTILPKDSSVNLRDGDKFSFLPEACWFEVHLEFEEENRSTDLSETLKRPLGDPVEDSTKKRIKLEDDEEGKNNIVNNSATDITLTNGVTVMTETDINDVPVESSTGDNNMSTDQPIVKTETEETGNKVEEEPSTSDEANTEVKQEPADKDNDKDAHNDNPVGTSNTAKPNLRRERCWYGSSCYRKNATHRDDYSHLGDPDYDSDPNDDRPSCSFGGECYRQNQGHRNEYKHPPGKPASKKKRRAKKAAKKTTEYEDDYSDLSEEEEDPYAADGDSDEFIADGDKSSSDSDWEDSQPADEDSEALTTLLKEAKKFTK